MTIENIKAYANNLVKLRKAIAEQEEITKTLKAQRVSLQNDILSGLKELNIGSIGTQDGTKITKAVRKTVQIVDEETLISELKAKGMNDYVREQVDKELFAGLVSQLVKENKLLDGTEYKETEYVSIRNTKK